MQSTNLPIHLSAASARSIVPIQGPALWSQVASLPPGELWLLIAPFRLLEIERLIIPRLALQGLVHIIVGGHSYDADGILRSLRKLTPRAAEIRKRIRQRRAPTAFQLRALLQKTPQASDPVIVLNFLINYLDEEEQQWKSQYLLESSIAELRRLSQRAPVLVSVRPPQNSRHEMFECLGAAADRIIEFIPPPPPRQLKLF